MTLNDVLPYVAYVATVVAAVYAGLAYHRPPKGATAMAEAIRHRRPFFLHWLPTLVALAAVMFGYYDRHHERPEQDPHLVSSYGIMDGMTFQMTVNGSYLGDYQAGYKMALIVREAYSNIDRMTDVYIGKGGLYTITDDTQYIVKIGINGLWVTPNTINTIEYNLVVVPNDFSMDQIKTLSDVARIGGKIIISRWRQDFLGFSTGPPTASPPSPTPPK